LRCLAIRNVKRAGARLTQQCLDRPPHVVIAGASAGQKDLASFGGHLPCRVEEFLDLLPAFPVHGVKAAPFP
jgi:hypothetical protein